MRYALVDDKGVTVNLVIWDGKAEYSLPEGYSLVPEDEALPFEPEPPIE